MSSEIAHLDGDHAVDDSARGCLDAVMDTLMPVRTAGFLHGLWSPDAQAARVGRGSRRDHVDVRGGDLLEHR
jgi:hypothetical protein